ncbi:hypothetical protein WJX81_001298 [Elliptochloris bilobata]|uniref:Uncharacterized protein n=1 Tax=Elliptochloris bilobata TaxID=381761 RepID=A0AAW1RXI1_9CHLO
MPRASQKATSTFRVEVIVDSSRLLIPCGQGERSVGWLLQQEHQDDATIIALHTSSGAELCGSDAVADVVDSGATLTAVAADAASALHQADSVSTYGHNARVFDLAFSPAVRDLLASGSDDSTAKVWRLRCSQNGSDDAGANTDRSTLKDADRGRDGGYGHAKGGPGTGRRYEQVASFHGHTDSVLRVAWAPDGALIASASADTSVRLWRAHGGAVGNSSAAGYGAEEVAVLEGHPEEVYACEFVGPGGVQMVTASADELALWDLETRAVVGRGRPIATTADLAGGAVPKRWQPGHVFCVRPQPPGAGALLAAACSDGALRLWDRGSGAVGAGDLAPVAAVRLHNAMGAAVAWDPAGRHVASVATDGTVVVMDVRRLQGALWCTRLDGAAFCCAYLPGASHCLMVGGEASRIHVFDTGSGSGPEGGAELGAVVCGGPPRRLLCLAASADGRALAASGDAVVLDARVPSNSMRQDGGDALFEPPQAAANGKVVFSLGEAVAVRDAFKEESRKYRRTVFDFGDWARHRSTTRYLRHIKDLMQSRIVRGLAQPLLVVVGVATVTAVYETLREEDIWFLGQLPSLCVKADQAFNLTSFALSLLLVFRTNTSYSRWMDARKVWGGILNRSRDLVRQGLTWFGEERAAERDMLARWTVAFSLATMAHLREHSHLEEDLQDVLPAEERAALLAAQHRPNTALQVMSQLVAAASLRETQATRMDENLTFFADSVGACERILKTPIPLSYTRHTSRFLVIWLFFLPLTLWPTARWSTIPASAVIAFLLLGIEEIGVQIEEPFSILPLENICAAAKRDIAELCRSGSDLHALVKSQQRPGAVRQSGMVGAAQGASENGVEQS